MRAGLLLSMAVVVAGCAQSRTEISRFDGQPLTPTAEEQARTECTAKSQLAVSSVPYRPFGDPYGFSRAMEAVRVEKAAFDGCMAEKGIRVTYAKVE